MVSNLAAAALVSLALVSSVRSAREAMDSERLAMSAPGGEGHKEIIFVRHGQSTGNALGGAGNAKDLISTALSSMTSKTSWPFDSVLSGTGEQQVQERVQQLQKGSLNQRLLHSEVLIVSPLRRAMATALLLMAHAYHATLSKSAENQECENVCDCAKNLGLPLPEVRVMIELREKVKSSSDEIGTGKGAYAYTPDYVYKVSNQLEDSTFCGEHVLAPLAQKLKEAYEAEEVRTDSWVKHAEDEETGAFLGVPNNALYEATNIQYVMKKVSAMDKRSFLLVGHSGWSRFAFTHVMPWGGDDFEDPDDNLKMNARLIHSLNNVGLLCVGMDSDGVTGPSKDDCTLEETKALPNFVTKSSFSMPALVLDAAKTATLPSGAHVRRYWINRTDTKKEGILALSSSPESTHKWFLSWSSVWGKPKEQFVFELPRSGPLPFSADVVGPELHIKIGEKGLSVDANPEVKSGFEGMLAEIRRWIASPQRQHGKGS